MLEIARTLIRAGHESWFVGGAVRDALLGHPNLDWDLATAATPQQVQRLFRRTVPVGIEFGTVGVLDDAGVMHEVTTFRRDVQTDGRHAVVEFGASLDEDLARRDFTINAIAYGPTRASCTIRFAAARDLERAASCAPWAMPRTRMREDRLRALRAIRFAARFRFAIEPDTWSAIVDRAPHLGRLSMERVQQEIEKTMAQVELPGDGISLVARQRRIRACSLRRWRASVTSHSRRSIACRARARAAQSQRTSNRLTALVLELSPDRVRASRCKELRFSNDRVRWIGDLVERWHAVGRRIRDALRGRGDPRMRRCAGGWPRSDARA